MTTDTTLTAVWEVRSLWAQATAMWCVVSYIIAADDLDAKTTWLEKQLARPVAECAKALLVMLALWLVVDVVGLEQYLLIGSIGVITVLVGLVEKWAGKKKLLAELEIVAAGVVISLLWVVANSNGAELRTIITTTLLDTVGITRIAGTIAVLVFLGHAGNIIVRGVLGKSEVQVPEASSKQIKLGRLIGTLERIILALVVAAGSYEALAFLVTAKGLIRSPQMNKEHLSEYFLVGTLASVALSLCAGLALANIWARR